MAVLEESLPGGEDNTFVFVYHRAGGMTDADRATVERQYNTLAKRYPPKAAAGKDDEGPPTRLSTDGKAMMFTLDVSTTYGGKDEIRDRHPARPGCPFVGPDGRRPPVLRDAPGLRSAHCGVRPRR